MKNTLLTACKKGAALFLAGTAAAVLLSGCSQTQGPASSALTDGGASSGMSAEQTSSPYVQEVTLEGETVFDTGKYQEQIQNAQQVSLEVEYRYFCQTMEEMYQNSTDLIDGQVEKVEFVWMPNGQPYTKTRVKVLESFKGSLKAGDQIIVYNNEGYITQADKNRAANPNASVDSEDETTVLAYHDSTAAAQERYPQAGDRYLYGLRKDDTVLKGAYFPTMGSYTIYRTDGNGRYTRFPNKKAKQGETPTGNSEESFTLDWFREQCKALAGA